MKIATTPSRLAAYSTMAATVLAIQNEADGQVIYTNINPDKVLQSTGPYDTLHLDVTGDAITDFIFNAFYFYTSYTASAVNYDHLGVDGINGARIAYTMQSTNIYTWSSALFANLSAKFAQILPANTPINNTLNFNNNVELFYQQCFPAMYSSMMDYCWTAGMPSAVVKYIGFRLKNGPLKYYGWMRLSIHKSTPFVPVPTSIKIYDYAINWTPNTPILAGEGLICIATDAVGTGTTASHWARVYWEPRVDIDHYEVSYRIPGGAWETKTVPPDKTSTKLNGLECSTDYEWQVRCACLDGSLSDYSEVQTFTTASCRLEGEDMTENDEAVSMYANANRIYIYFDEVVTEPSRLFIYNMTGQLVSETIVTQQQNILEVSVPSGMYTAKLVTPSGNIGKLISISN
ncbi:MAG TPA: fibronectin type III domain-containing protein [Chitinophagales bacterium]|nr:fibronectin type III domain-containing protein [Chitinophagales bacterium]